MQVTQTLPHLPQSILLVEDNGSDAELVRQYLAEIADFTGELVVAARLSLALEHLSRRSFETVLLDLWLPDSQGLATFQIVRRAAPQAAVVLISRLAEHQDAVRAMQDGAQEYLQKSDLCPQTLAHSLRWSLVRQRLWSDRARRDQGLDRSTAYLRDLVEDNTDIILVVDREGVLRYANRSAGQLFGMPPGQLVGREFGFPLAKGETTEIDVISAEGRGRVAEMRVGETAWEGNLAYLATLRDITQRKQAEEERARLVAAIEQSGEGILMADREGRVHYVNPAFERMMESSAAQLRGMELAQALDIDPAQPEYHAMSQAFRRGVPWRGQTRSNSGCEGGERRIDYRISPLRDQSGGVTDFVAMVRDISFEHRLECQLRKSQRLQAVGTLAGGIAHEVNNQLASIIGYTELSLDNTPQSSPAWYDLQRVLKACDRVKTVVSQLMTFSRRREGHRRPTYLDQAVREALVLVRASLPTNVRITDEIDADSLLVLADSSDLQQVVINLATNSAQALGAQGGALGISLREVEVDGEGRRHPPGLEAGRYGVLTVSDNGPGIAPEQLDRLFDPFYTTKAPGQGTGLGLAVVHGIVHSLEGQVSVRSQPGQGCVFQVYIPLYQAGLGAHLDQPMRVMFVDDDQELVSVWRRNLGGLGMEVEGYSDPRQALEVFAAAPHDYHAVVTDYMMPQLTGLELAKRVKDLNPQIPVILSTGYGDMLTPQEAEERGVDELLIKPYSKGRLATVIGRLTA